MPKAIWNGTIIAESDDTVVVENNHYFPPKSVRREFVQHSDYETVCGWKGTASYLDVVVDGETNRQAAWYYASPKQAASNICDHVAFWKGVVVES
ncbi:hypothetical protein K227x_34170 [Rubripirellula lacrimiformis]|uniref:DUF427 domain-containing protein n=1 Tax=Rubripirellula lacrimiformis TaxID=1930273 RepID=A0A517ND05_9BACT|nr:DUF427 domain-containing protein [Rubripirellula lacrimiformis]QDT05019.1 hypothetical protein K227x_34170 [Rubripirellula lacrimiformis]